MSSAGAVWRTGSPRWGQYTRNLSIVKAMPYKDPKIKKAKHKQYSAAYYENNKARLSDKSKKSRKEHRALWAEYKTMLACSVCGFAHPAVIDFHHPPGTKTHGVNSLIKNGRYALAYEEAAKCIILCANCHRIHHYNEKGAKAPSIQAASSSSSDSTS
jgi:hypothetical protein